MLNVQNVLNVLKKEEEEERGARVEVAEETPQETRAAKTKAEGLC